MAQLPMTLRHTVGLLGGRVHGYTGAFTATRAYIPRFTKVTLNERQDSE